MNAKSPRGLLKICSVVFGVAALAGGFVARAARAESETTVELAKMYEQDQSDRRELDTNPRPHQWDTISAHDKEHYNRVLQLMHANKLVAADDYYYAAMIMQHGSEPRDYMLAHILAMAAAQRGNKAAVWLSAASFDRLMVSAKQPQIFGTQYYSEGNEPLKIRQPFESQLIPDSLRKAFDAPTLAENEERLKMLNDRKTQAETRSKP